MAHILKHGVLRSHGTILIADPDRPHEVQRDTLQCCHCQRVWVVHPGSGRRRGFCLKCNGPTCGAESCGECVPIGKRIELFEQGLRASL